MAVCAICRREMRHLRSGVVVRWEGHQCRAGDLHFCDGCGCEVVTFHEGTEAFEDRSAVPGADLEVTPTTDVPGKQGM